MIDLSKEEITELFMEYHKWNPHRLTLAEYKVIVRWILAKLKEKNDV
jgi:hypothetical protein